MHLLIATNTCGLKLATARLRDMHPMKMADHDNSAGDIVVFYPGNSLLKQVSTWAGRNPSYQLKFSFVKSLPEIRTAARRSCVALVDATEDPAQAMVAFTQAMAELEASSVVVYTETIHAGMELFVRGRGALLLLGPMDEAPWEGLFKGMLRSEAHTPRFGFMKRRRIGGEARRATVGFGQSGSHQSYPAGSTRPKTRDWRR